MTVPEILALARQHLSPADRGELAAHLVLELGQPKIVGVESTVAIRGMPHWTDEELLALRKVITAATSRLDTTPVEFARQAVGHLRAQVAPFDGNKA